MAPEHALNTTARPSGIPPWTSYSGLLNRVGLPLYSKLRGRIYGEKRSFLEESQWWSRAQLEEFQFLEVHKLLTDAFEAIPFYQRKYAEAGVQLSDIQSLDDLKKLPPLEGSEIRAHREEMRNPRYPGKLLRHSTGGSSGKPTQFYRTRESYDWRTAATDRAYSWAGAIVGKPVMYLWGAPTGKLSRKQKLTTFLYNAYRRELKLNTLVQPAGFWQDALRHAVAFKPVALVAYTSNIEKFCEEAVRSGVRIPSLQSVISAAEPVYPELYNTVRNALGVPLFNTYGSREFMSIAAECDQHAGLHIHSENLLLENYDAIPGSNELLVTDLHNFGMPFIRYRIGDAAQIVTAPCACGRGLPRLGTIEGRLIDLLWTHDGRIVPGELIPHVMKDLPEVIEFQAHQTAVDRIVLRLILSSELSEKSSTLLRSELLKAFGPGTDIVIERVSEIPKRASGKRRVVIGLHSE